jgi:hypothetical protein
MMTSVVVSGSGFCCINQELHEVVLSLSYYSTFNHFVESISSLLLEGIFMSGQPYQTRHSISLEVSAFHPGHLIADDLCCSCCCSFDEPHRNAWWGAWMVVMRYQGGESIYRDALIDKRVNVADYLTAEEKEQMDQLTGFKNRCLSGVLWAISFPCGCLPLLMWHSCMYKKGDAIVNAIADRVWRERVLPELLKQADQEVDRRIVDKRIAEASTAGRIIMSSDGSISGDPQAIAALLVQSMGRGGVLNGVQRPVPVEGMGAVPPQAVSERTPLMGSR